MPQTTDEELLQLFRNPRQLFPIYYPGEAQFLLDNKTPSGLVGATARINIEISNNPIMATGIRIRNVYEIEEKFRTVDLLTYLARLDGEQSIETNLTQQNIIVREMSQELLTGGKDGSAASSIHWHPFETPYPFKGGNNINLKFKRETSYPEEIVSVVVKATLTGWVYMSDAVPDAGAPSSGYDAS